MDPWIDWPNRKTELRPKFLDDFEQNRSFSDLHGFLASVYEKNPGTPLPILVILIEQEDKELGQALKAYLERNT